MMSASTSTSSGYEYQQQEWEAEQQPLSTHLGLRPLITSTQRILAYSDAIFSIIATIMILPLLHSEIGRDENLYNVLNNLLPKLGIYILSFVVMYAIWTVHVLLFEVIEKADDVTVLMNLAIVMASTFFPYVYTLLSAYPSNGFAISMFCACVIVIGVFQLIYIWYVFRHAEILQEQVRESPHERVIQVVLYITASINPMIAVLSILMGLFVNGFLVSLFMSANILIRKTVISLYLRYKRRRGDHDMTPERLPILGKNSIPKERVEAFSDGIFAIVATLLILDICESNVPNAKDVKEFGGVGNAVGNDWRVFIAYGGSFVTVCCFWFIHHSLYYYIKYISHMMSFYNALSLCCIGILPAAFQLTTKYDSSQFEKNEMYAIQMSCAIICLAGVFQMVVFVCALRDCPRHLHPDASHGSASHLYTLAKLLIYPLVSLLVYFLSTKQDSVTVLAYNSMLVGMPLLFVLLKLISVRLTAIRAPGRAAARGRQQGELTGRTAHDDRESPGENIIT